MRARDLMTTPVHTVHPSTTVAEAAAVLTRYAITALPVLDDDDHLIGMVSEGDLLWHRVPASSDAHLWRRPDDRVEDPPGTVGDVMSSPALALSAAASAGPASRNRACSYQLICDPFSSLVTVSLAQPTTTRPRLRISQTPGRS